MSVAETQVDTIINDAKVEMDAAKDKMDDAKKTMDAAKVKMDAAKVKMDAAYKKTGYVYTDDADDKKEYKEAKTAYETAKSDYENDNTTHTNAKKEYVEKRKNFLELTAKRNNLNDDKNFLNSMTEEELYKLKNPIIAKVSTAINNYSPLPEFTNKKKPTPSSSSSSSTPARQITEPISDPLKQITITFVQSGNDCFVESYKTCDYNSISFSEKLTYNLELLNPNNNNAFYRGEDIRNEMLSKLLVIDNNKPVQENISIIHENLPVIPLCADDETYKSVLGDDKDDDDDNGTTTERGGYDSTRSTIRSVKSRKYTKPRKTSKYSPYNKFMRTTRRRRRL